MRKQFLLIILALCSTVLAQTKEAFETGSSTLPQKGFLDPSHFTINNSVSFGMASISGYSDLKSQSIYSTMLQYKFSAPVTVNLNFGLPIHSTITSAQNLNQNNLQSMEYFKNMPLSASLSWQPTKTINFQLNIVKNIYDNYFGGNADLGVYNRSIFQQPSIFSSSKNAEKK